MTFVSLVHPGEIRKVSIVKLITTCELFQQNPVLLSTPYVIRSSVTLRDFRQFVHDIEGNHVNITDENLSGLLQLSQEFHTAELAMRLDDFRTTQTIKKQPLTHLSACVSTAIYPLLGDSFTYVINDVTLKTSLTEAMVLSPAVCDLLTVDACARRFIISDNEIQWTDFYCLQNLLSGGQVTVLRSQRRSLVSLARQLGNIAMEELFFGAWSHTSSDTIVLTLSKLLMSTPSEFCLLSDLSLLSFDALDDVLTSQPIVCADESTLFRNLMALGPEYAPLLHHVHFSLLTPSGPLTLLGKHTAQQPPESLWYDIAPQVKALSMPRLDSHILSDIPSLFDCFNRKQYKLLWRGSRDGFTPNDFHHKCDGHSNTLMLVLDTKGNIFGGFTPVKWESRLKIADGNNRFKGDESLMSFLFTLKNPHNLPARKFPLIQEHKDFTIFCNTSGGPEFGMGANGYGDLAIRGTCNESTKSSTALGGSYVNDTGLKCRMVFTGAEHFTVKEIEIFEITD
jgi:hypothetical protein